MNDIDYINLEEEYFQTGNQDLVLSIRKERDRRRHEFMHSAIRSEKLWKWHWDMIETFKPFYERQSKNNQVSSGLEQTDR